MMVKETAKLEKPPILLRSSCAYPSLCSCATSSSTWTVLMSPPHSPSEAWRSWPRVLGAHGTRYQPPCQGFVDEYVVSSCRGHGSRTPRRPRDAKSGTLRSAAFTQCNAAGSGRRGIPGPRTSRPGSSAFWSANSASVRMPWSLRLASSLSLLIRSSESGAAAGAAASAGRQPALQLLAAGRPSVADGGSPRRPPPWPFRRSPLSGRLYASRDVASLAWSCSFSLRSLRSSGLLLLSSSVPGPARRTLTQ